jgi:ABC-type enterochelin transport system permease subunit
MLILILLNKIKCLVVLFSSLLGVLESIIRDLTSNSTFLALDLDLYMQVGQWRSSAAQKDKKETVYTLTMSYLVCSSQYNSLQTYSVT